MKLIHKNGMVGVRVEFVSERLGSKVTACLYDSERDVLMVCEPRVREVAAKNGNSFDEVLASLVESGIAAPHVIERTKKLIRSSTR